MAMGAADLVDVSLSEVWASMAVINDAQEFRAARTGGKGLSQALRIVQDALLGTSPSGGRLVPSAGAIFPYDVLVLVGGEENSTEPGLFRVDLVRRTCVRLPLSPAALRRLAESMPAGVSAGQPVWTLVLSRPWLSVRKYGPRGYLYTHLDSGHAATSLLGTAQALGSAELHLRVNRKRIQHDLAEFLPFREVHSVLAIGAATRSFEPGSLVVLDPVHAARTDSHGDLERYSWAKLPVPLATGQDSANSAGKPVRVGPAGEYSPRWAIRPEEWGELTDARQSCKEFLPQAVDGRALAEALGALATPLTSDIEDSSGLLRLTLIVTSETVAADYRAVLPADGVEVVVAAEADDPEQVSRLCMGQRHVGGAKAFLLAHVDSRETFERGDAQSFREILFRAAAVAQLVYLGAVRTGIAVTAIGAYDLVGWRAVARLSGNDEPVYLMALGTDGDGAVKQDRAAIAYAHGE